MITSMATIIANCTGDAGTRTPSPARQWRGNRMEALDLGERPSGNPSALRSSTSARMHSPHTFATFDHVDRNSKEVHHG
jgi:hypothetical protein